VLTETVKPAGVLPLAGDTLSHEFPEVTAAFTLMELADVILSAWELGAVPPTM
jgi:hypothetical protein